MDAEIGAARAAVSCHPHARDELRTSLRQRLDPVDWLEHPMSFIESQRHLVRRAPKSPIVGFCAPAVRDARDLGVEIRSLCINSSRGD